VILRRRGPYLTAVRPQLPGVVPGTALALHGVVDP
jgi:hypothetical protein